MDTISYGWLIKTLCYCIWAIIVFVSTKKAIQVETKKGTINNLLSVKYKWIGVLLVYGYFIAGAVALSAIVGLLMLDIFIKIFILSSAISVAIVLYCITVELTSKKYNIPHQE